MKKKRILIVVTAALAVLVAIWFIANPRERFGWCRFAFTTYNALPRPITDLQVRADGTTRRVDKTHQLTFERIEWLLTPKPEVLIIALGWDGMTIPDDRIREYKGCEVHTLKNKEAIELYNRLKQEGKRVAIHYHSTC